jgi:3-hydroxybutyryl-CoA dehydrogenase
MHNVTVLGAGVLGSQIAFQSAFMGKDVVVYDISQEGLDALAGRWDYLKPLYVRDLPDVATPEKLNAAISRIRLSNDLVDALKDADLVIEAVPELLEIKLDTWAKVGAAAPAKTIFATNSSTMLPSQLAEATGRPAQFLALHFANEIWNFNTAEVMGHPGTDPAVFEAVATFAEEIGMVPVRIHKEYPGYIVNGLLIPWVMAAHRMYVHNIADFTEIDTTWRIATKMPLGPFQITDMVGLNTAYAVSSTSPDPDMQEFARLIKERFIDKGRMGIAVGKGFYDYF